MSTDLAIVLSMLCCNSFLCGSESEQVFIACLYMHCRWRSSYRKSGNFGHGFILAPKYEVPKLNTPKYVTLQKLSAKIEHCLNIFLYLYSLVCTFLSYFFPK